MARILVTGGGGFIGSHLVEALLVRGDEVRVLDNFSTGSSSNLAHLHADIQVQKGDIRDSAALKDALIGVDSVFHLAAMVSVPQSIEDPTTCYAVNIHAVADLMEQARQGGVQSLVLASSTAVYGASQSLPLNEAQAPDTLSPYAASKLFNESAARIYAENDGLHATALRFFNVYGPRQRPDSDYAAVIPRFIHSLQANQSPTIFGDGEQTRDFIYVADVVAACLVAGKNQQISGQVFNVCSGHETSLNQLLATLRPLYPDAPAATYTEPRLGDVSRSVGDPTFAREELDFNAEVQLSKGLQQTIEAL